MAQTQVLTLSIKHGRDLHLADSGNRTEFWTNLRWILDGLFGGDAGPTSSIVRVNDGAAYASEYMTFANPLTANDTITVGGIVFTAKASGAGADEWNIGASATLDAAAAAACMNANTTFSNALVATSALGVLTITSLIPGLIGNMITIAKSAAQLTLHGAKLAGGTANASVPYTF